jgi:hypothetical protein
MLRLFTSMTELQNDPTASVKSTWICPSCGSTASARYCGVCGERAVGARVFPADAGGAREPSRRWVARFIASLRALASPPGRLTADWIQGRRVGYLTPLSLFLWVNIAFFLIQSASGLGILAWPLRAHLADDSIAWITTRLLAWHRPNMAVPTAAYSDVFNALESVHAKSLVIVMVPPFAIVVALLLFDRRRRMTDVLTFATHFFAFALIWLCALFPAVAVVLRLVAQRTWPAGLPHEIDLVVTGIEVGVLAWYLYRALATVYELHWLRRAVTVLALILALHVILKAYHVVVFATTLYAI